MPRSTKPWTGATADVVPPPRVRLRIFARYGGNCQLTGREIRPGDAWDLDHRVAIINGGANTEENLWPVLRSAHREKTAADVAEKKRVDARAKSHLGIKPIGPDRPIQGPPMPTTRKAAARKGRSGDRLPVPGFRMPPNFVSASERNG